MNPALHTTCPLPRMSLPASDDSIADEESQRIDAKVEEFFAKLGKKAKRRHPKMEFSRATIPRTSREITRKCSHNHNTLNYKALTLVQH